MSQTARYQETLRRLAMIDEGFVEDEAGLGLDLARTSVLDPKIAGLVLGLIVVIRTFLSFSLKPRSRTLRRGGGP